MKTLIILVSILSFYSCEPKHTETILNPVQSNYTIDNQNVVGTWIIPANGRYKLAIGDVPISATRLTWKYDNINWCPGQGNGWENICNIQQPCKNHNERMYAIHCKFGDKTFHDCSMSPERKIGKQSTHVIFYVKDENYSDNTGSFEVTIIEKD